MWTERKVLIHYFPTNTYWVPHTARTVEESIAYTSSIGAFVAAATCLASRCLVPELADGRNACSVPLGWALELWNTYQVPHRQTPPMTNSEVISQRTRMETHQFIGSIQETRIEYWKTVDVSFWKVQYKENGSNTFQAFDFTQMWHSGSVPVLIKELWEWWRMM
jgi:hypothetical protein